jgi:hypothetical protein
MEALKGVLSPEELEEYRLRSSMSASLLRSETGGFDVTPEEFKFLFKMREEAAGKDRDYYEMQKKERAAFEKQFGAERAAALERGMDLTYRYTAEAAERYGLSPGIAEKAWTLKRRTMAEATRIRKQVALSEEERRNRLRQVRGEVEAEMERELGSKAWDWAKKYDGAWLQLLTELKVREE